MRNIHAPTYSQDYATSQTTAGFQGFFNHWELRSFIILSMILQMLLTLWTYQRKGISSQPIRRIAWLAVFLAADFSATLCLGGIFHLNIKPKYSSDHTENSSNRYLIALWAPFILLHLGRHSSITTFSLGDNEFWLSHLIRFIYHELTAILICILASAEKQFRYTTAVLFITGTLKLGERVWALKRGSMREVKTSTFKKADPGFTSSEISRYKISIANRRGGLEFENPTDILNAAPDQVMEGQAASDYADVRYLCAAYKSFNKCKGMYTDSSFEYVHNTDPRGQTLAMDVNIACDLMEMELSFAYDLFYTKSICLHTVWGWIARVISFISICCALGLFACADKHSFLSLDVGITYTLLILALTLESVSFVEAFLSNRTFVQVGFQGGRKWRVLEGIIRRLRNFICEVRDQLFPRQPAFMGQFNLLSFSFGEHNLWSCIRFVLNFFELKELHNNYRYTTYIQIDNLVAFRDAIFSGATDRFQHDCIEHPKTFDNITPISARVRNVLRQYDTLGKNVNLGFEQCLLVWHLATDLCHRTSEEQPHLTNAKYLSDYMLYLLVIHPSMLSSSTTPELKCYRNAYAAAIQLYNDTRIENDGDEVYYALEIMEERVQDNIPLRLRQLRNSLLLDALSLASKLKNLDAARVPVGPYTDIWRLLFDVWVDMLYFAAIQCRGKDHAEQLGSGGEFITYVWLFILHSHMGSRYRIEVEHE